MVPSIIKIGDPELPKVSVQSHYKLSTLNPSYTIFLCPPKSKTVLISLLNFLGILHKIPVKIIVPPICKGRSTLRVECILDQFQNEMTPAI